MDSIHDVTEARREEAATKMGSAHPTNYTGT